MGFGCSSWAPAGRKEAVRQSQSGMHALGHMGTRQHCLRHSSTARTEALPSGCSSWVPGGRRDAPRRRVSGVSHQCEARPWAPSSLGCCVCGQPVGGRTPPPPPLVIPKKGTGPQGNQGQERTRTGTREDTLGTVSGTARSYCCNNTMQTFPAELRIRSTAGCALGVLSFFVISHKNWHMLCSAWP